MVAGNTRHFREETCDAERALLPLAEDPGLYGGPVGVQRDVKQIPPTFGRLAKPERNVAQVEALNSRP